MTDAVMLQGDCLEVLQDYPDKHFDAACFSPPYGIGQVFDVRADFAPGGRFTACAEQINRVSKVWAVNLGQRMLRGAVIPFTEELVLAQYQAGVSLFDRWVVLKSGALMPQRGRHVKSAWEYVLLFADDPEAVAWSGGDGRTAFEASPARALVRPPGSPRPPTRGGANNNTQAPFSPTIPRQVFTFHAPPGGRVLDPFAGSGTTLRVAEEMGLQAVGIEIDPSLVNEWSRRRTDR